LQLNRLIYTVAVGKPKFGAMAMGLGRSLSLIGDTTPRAILTDLDGFDWKRHFDVVVRPNGPRTALDKLFACETTDADEVLAIDGDMLAFRRLDEIFEWCQGKWFAVQGYLTTEGSFHRRPIPEVLNQYGVDQMPQFNGGLAFYRRGNAWSQLLDAMRVAESRYSELGFEAFRGGKSEEVCMLDAMLKVGGYDLDVLQNRCEFVARQRKIEFVRPALFHAWRYKDFTIYWKELKKLEALDDYADRHPSMYLSRGQRWKRSIQLRLMRFRGWL
jgi:hypothetical protein